MKKSRQWTKKTVFCQRNRVRMKELMMTMAQSVLDGNFMKYWLSTSWSTDWAPYEALIETLTKHWLKPSIGKKFRPWLKIQSFLYPSFCFCRVKSYCVTFFKRLSWKLLRFFLILWVCMLFLWAAWRILPLILCSWTYLRKIYQKFFSFYNRK